MEQGNHPLITTLQGDQRAGIQKLTPPLFECAFCPFDVLGSRLAMLLGQVP
jgi:hypothetical protein